MKQLFTLVTSLLVTTSVLAQNEFIHPTKTGTELIDSLQQNYSVTNAQSYNAARDAMFEQIDKKEGSQISCVYTGYTITFTDRQDAQGGNNEPSDFNTEHTWPQSFFDQASPMRTDIHHLYPTRQDVNAARSNLKFDEIPDENTNTWYRENSNQSSIPVSNIDEYSELLSNTSFEPREDHKGNVARALFYFWAIYQDNSNVVNDATDNEAFFNSMKDVLLSWHDADPVDQAEVDRSTAIESVQGNRNPFIHDTTLVRRAFFGGMPVSAEDESQIPVTVTLSQNYPNPFNPVTSIRFELENAQFVSLSVFDQLGRKVSTLVSGRKSAGAHTVSFNASSLGSGVYYYRLQTNEAVLTRKMTLIK